MLFTVEVSCCGSQWYLYAPAFGVSRFVSDKERIREEARAMIAKCGAAPSEFEIDLELGRVIDKAVLLGIELVTDQP
ncbi:hypothetical protein [Nocardia jinanensis]|uniref:Uncharacterized protein n=1 Tax=Nocardia jinanensis TaxID=382504 RepID=A0A917RX60_9NOCA|nr:hypothetical protein [Nocardia jinanensis]GGL38730.1 hypothetical protein GCM10011588_61670 [Nocardia jinanensis]